MSEQRESEARPAVSVVVPVRNEGGNITPLVAEIAEALGKSVPFEIIYVNDGSTDRTEVELTLLMASRPWLRHVKHQSSCGQSAAVRSGVFYARAPVVVTLDGDGQNDPASIPALLEVLAAGAAHVSLVAGQRVGRKATGFKEMAVAHRQRRARARCCATARAIPVAASRRSAAISFWRCPISTGCTVSSGAGSPRGLRYRLCGRDRPAASAEYRTTACGTGSGWDSRSRRSLVADPPPAPGAARLGGETEC